MILKKPRSLATCHGIQPGHAENPSLILPGAGGGAPQAETANSTDTSAASRRDLIRTPMGDIGRVRTTY
ncbi:hypothetical protein [Kibdelosporangium philippinense]|uniref:hypothetical protein n=1 Tax=Kibdelosporangium philippinense TaxID=211113 RepID=UPI00360DCB30